RKQRRSKSAKVMVWVAPGTHGNARQWQSTWKVGANRRPCFGTNATYMSCTGDVEPYGSIIERPRICCGRRRMYARLAIRGRQFFGVSRAGFEPFLVVTGDALVAFRQSHQLFAADHVVDILERLVASTAIDFVQDGVGRRLPVREHHFARLR